MNEWASKASALIPHGEVKGGHQDINVNYNAAYSCNWCFSHYPGVSDAVGCWMGNLAMNILILKLIMKVAQERSCKQQLTTPVLNLWSRCHSAIHLATVSWATHFWLDFMFGFSSHPKIGLCFQQFPKQIKAVLNSQPLVYVHWVSPGQLWFPLTHKQATTWNAINLPHCEWMLIVFSRLEEIMLRS